MVKLVGQFITRYTNTLKLSSKNHTDQKFFGYFLGRRESHGVIVTKVTQGKVHFFLMTNHPVANRWANNQILFNNGQQALVSYVINVEDFILLREGVSDFKSNINFKIKKKYVDSLYNLKDQPVNELDLDYKLYYELKDLLEINQHLDFKSQKVLVMFYLNSKGVVDFDFKEGDKIITIYQNNNLSELLFNKANIMFMLMCTSNGLDIAMRLIEISDLETKEKIFPILERQALELLENPATDSMFYFDSLKNKDSKIEGLRKVDKVKDLDELSQQADLNIIEEEIVFDKRMKLLEGFPESE